MTDLLKKIALFDEQIVLIEDDVKFSYKQLALRVESLQKELLRTIAPHEVVAILGDYSFENIALFLALYENKNIIVPITSTIKSVIEINVQESFCKYVITMDDEGMHIEMRENSATHEMLELLHVSNSAGLILFSSGSTGKPKAMIHNLDTLIDSYADKKAKAMNMLVFLMFDHIGGLNTLFNVLSMGSTLIIPKDRDAKSICKLIQDYKIMVLPSSPTFLNLMLISGEYEKFDLKSLRMITYGTEAMPASLLIKLKGIFPRVKFLQTFGTSETGISTTTSQNSQSLYMKIDELSQEYKIVENELWLRSRTQILGYLNASMESFTADGWFKTGDLVESAEDGYIKIIGRSKEVINVGGEKVLPIEVESVVLSMQNIDDCMAYGEPNAITGQSVVIDVVTNDEMSSRELKKEIRQFCKDKLANYKIPTKVNIVVKTNFGDRFKKIRVK